MLRIFRGGDAFRYRYAYGAELVIADSGEWLVAERRSPCTFEDLLIYLLGPVLGFVLRLRGIVALHASAVEIDGRAVALVGAAGAGKSTTAAAFARQGFPVLTDDICTLMPGSGEFMVAPDGPILRLWPRSAELLGDTADALPFLSPPWDKRFLDLERHGYPVARTPRALSAIYLLDGEPSPSCDLEIEAVAGREALIALVANTYGNHVLEPHLRAAELDLLVGLLASVPVRRLRWPLEGASPAALCARITEDFRRPASLDSVDLAVTVPELRCTALPPTAR